MMRNTPCELRSVAVVFPLLFLSGSSFLFAQRDREFGLDSTILAYLDPEGPLLWPNGRVRSSFLNSDSIDVQEGYRMDGTHWFKAEYNVVYDPDGLRRGHRLVRYEAYFENSVQVEVTASCRTLSDTAREFEPSEEWKTYYPSGGIRSISEFDSFLERSGAYVEYHSNGVVRWKGQYCVRFMADDPPCPDDVRVGEIREIRTSNASMKCGIWEHYDQCGELLETVTYDWK